MFGCGSRNVKTLHEIFSLHTLSEASWICCIVWQARLSPLLCSSLCPQLFTHENSVNMVALSDGGRRCCESCCVSACPGSVPKALKPKCCSFCSSDRPQRLCSPASCPPAAPQQPDLLTFWRLPTLQKPHVRPKEERRGECTSALSSFMGDSCNYLGLCAVFT